MIKRLWNWLELRFYVFYAEQMLLMTPEKMQERADAFAEELRKIREQRDSR